MRLVVRMITSNSFSGSADVLVRHFLNAVEVQKKARIIKTGEYHKMPGHQEILFEVLDNVDLCSVMSFCGKDPILGNDTEAIFDTTQGSKISISGLQWLHLEVV
jgi:hypothetical protein